MTLKVTELDGFMQGGVMLPDPASMKFGTSGIYRAQGGASIPSNPNADHGFEWFQEIDNATRVGSTTLWTSFTPNPQHDKYAGGRVPGVDENGATDYSPTMRNITVTLFQDATIYVRVEGLILRYFHKGSTHSDVNNCVGYAIRVDGEVDMGSLMGGFAGRTDYGYYRYFDDTRGYAIAGSAGVSDHSMRIPARRMNSNQRAVCVHVSTWEQGYDIGAPRIGHGTSAEAEPMAFCCSSTHELTLTAGTHTIGVDIFCSANGTACATFNGGSYSTLQSLTGGSLTVSTVNQWGDVGSGVITLTGTCYDRNCPYPYPPPPGTLFDHVESDCYNPAVIADMVANSNGQITSRGGTSMSTQQSAMNRVCEVFHGTGSIAQNVPGRGYNSPGNNSVFLYQPSVPLWTRVSARSYNSHISGPFKCTNPTPDPNVYYYGPYRQGVNATVTYPLPTGYYYPVIGGDGCNGGGGVDPGYVGGGNPPLGDNGGGGCFKAGTLITMADGNLKPIQEIRVGDVVLGARIKDVPCGNDESKRRQWDAQALYMRPEPSIVTGVMSPARFYRRISINGAVQATPEHLFLVERRGVHRFIPAHKIRIGDVLRGASGESIPVISIESVRDEDQYFNFSCDGSHTYIAAGFVVHNVGNNVIGEELTKV